MIRKIALTSVFAICVAVPAFAAPSHTSATFPSNELMLEDYTYTGAATITNMGVYSGSVDANAEYDDCPANSYCDSTGVHACSSVGDGSFISSIAGASENTECYKACTLANANIAHATAVAGNDYYGAGTDTCSATTCETGWHVVSSGGLNDLIGDAEETGGGYEDQNTMTWSVDYGTHGAITGKARCSTQGGTNNGNTWSNPTTSATLPDSSGKNCYCQIDTYTPYGGTTQSVSSPWVLFDEIQEEDDDDEFNTQFCADTCTLRCAEAMGFDSPAYRYAMFESVTGVGTGQCERTEYECDAGYYLPQNAQGCVICPANSYCPGGTYAFDESAATGIYSCPAGTVSPAGMWDEDQCGQVLHVGNDVVYLRSTVSTEPSLNFKIGNNVYYANMTLDDVPMNSGTTNMLKVSDGEETYSIFDDTVADY